MQAVTYQGVNKVEVRRVPDPTIQEDSDILVRVTSTSICGSDLHFYHGMVPSLEKGYVIGHEPLGVVEEAGRAVTKVKRGDRVVIPFNVACGCCRFCLSGLESQCDTSNREAEAGAYFGCSRLYGDYPGAQAELLRVPFGNYMPFKVPPDCTLGDDSLLLLADALPSAYWAVLEAGVKPGDTVAVLGCGPIGLLVQKFAWLAGASRVLAYDIAPYRLAHAVCTNGVEPVVSGDVHRLGEAFREATKGGAHVVFDCVGMDGRKTWVEQAETMLRLQGGTETPIRTAAQAVRKGGTIQLVGIYGLRYNAFPLGDLFARNIRLKMGQASVIHLMPAIYELLVAGKLDPRDLITHRVPLAAAAHAYDIFSRRLEDCIKIMLVP